MKDAIAEKKQELERRRRAFAERQQELETRRRELDVRKQLFQDREELEAQEKALSEEEERLLRENERLDHLELGLDYADDTKAPGSESAAGTESRLSSFRYTAGLTIAIVGISIIVLGIAIVVWNVIFDLLQGEFAEGLLDILGALFVVVIGFVVLVIGGFVMPDTDEDSAETEESP